MKNLTIVSIDEPDIRDFASVRNRALENAETEWILFLDQDEEMSKDLKREIEKAISDVNYDAYYLKRQDIFMGKTLNYGETAGVSLVRLGKKGKGKWTRPVHEKWEFSRGRIGTLRNPLLHRPHASISSFLDKINRYSTLEAEYRFHEKIPSSLLKILLYPPGKFIRNYLFLQGYRDGVPGMIMAYMMSLHSFLTWTKLYLLWLRK